MFCTKCGSAQAEGVSFCSNCGNAVGAPVQAFPTQPSVAAPVYETAPIAQQASNRGAGLALAIVGFAVTAFGFFAGLYDLGAIANGEYAYVTKEEVGGLALISLLGIILGSISMRLKHPAGRWALVFALVSLLVMFNCAGHMVP